MSSGNPFGLSEISHFGSFQRVGGKAGGFINKKFFHPSSLRNQEKLWQAQTADEREKRKQDELEKRRQEERQVEDLRKQMYLAGQAKASDFVCNANEDELLKGMTPGERQDLREAADEQKRRMALLRKEHRQKDKDTLQASPAASPSPEDDEDGESDGDDLVTKSGHRKLAKSKYRENLHINGHKTVWGSFYSAEEKQWGFQCCKEMNRAVTCPQAPPEEEAEPGEEKKIGRKRRRKGGGDPNTAVEDSSAPPDAGIGSAASEAVGGSSGSNGAAEPQKAVPRLSNESLMDSRMFEAAAKRKEQKRLDEEGRAAAKVAKEKEQVEKVVSDGYLENLVQEPSVPQPE